MKAFVFYCIRFTCYAFCLFSLSLPGCANAPDRSSIAFEQALPPAVNGMLAEVDSGLTDKTVRANGRSAIHILADGIASYAARLKIIEAAEQSIDVQYYIFHHDGTGIVLSWYLWQAAERGVKIRILLDDMENRPNEYPFDVLDSHPNINVRLYNPFYSRSGRGLQIVTQFGRINHRMHNKSLTSDNRTSIVGGRNIGNEYFNADSHVNFGDMDVLLFGPVVREVSAQFDSYWNSRQVYPLALLNKSDKTAIDKKKAHMQLMSTLERKETQAYLTAVQETNIADRIEQATLPVIRAPVELWYDPPDFETAPSEGKGNTFVIDRLLELFSGADSEVYLVTPYFVPRRRGTKILSNISDSGVDVKVMTNSLSANDVVPVHSGYARHRKELLQSGVALFEVKPAPNVKKKTWSLTSTSSLHAKMYIVDHRYVFIGSFNLDPRSARLNTEMGVLIDSPELASRIIAEMVPLVKKIAYRVYLRDGDLVWRDLDNQQEYYEEPEAGLWRRFQALFFRLLPIDSLL